jgi:hypothetical protein
MMRIDTVFYENFKKHELDNAFYTGDVKAFALLKTTKYTASFRKSVIARAMLLVARKRTFAIMMAKIHEIFPKAARECTYIGENRPMGLKESRKRNLMRLADQSL